MKCDGSVRAGAVDDDDDGIGCGTICRGRWNWFDGGYCNWDVLESATELLLLTYDGSVRDAAGNADTGITGCGIIC